MKTFRGIDLTSMPPLVQPPKQGRVLILDGDAAAYRAASTVAKLPTGLRKFWSIVLTEMYVTHAESCIVHLTSVDCVKLNRKLYPTAKPYQANRSGKDKPPLLEALREGLASDMDRPDNVEVVLNRWGEADDAMRIDAERLQGGDVVVSSADKDLRQVTQPYFESSTGVIDRITDTFGWLKAAYTPSGVLKMQGHGNSFVLGQWLAGDTADNVVGLKRYEGKRIGPGGAIQLINEWGDERTAALNIIKAYAKIRQDPLAELAMLWLIRSPTDSAFKWLLSLDLPGKWVTWLESLDKRHTKILEAAHAKDGANAAADMDGKTT